MNERLSPKTERRLIALGNRKYCTALILTVGWIVLMLALWVLSDLYWGRPFLSAYNLAFPALCILPFFPFKVQRILRMKTFYGEVVSAKFSTVYKSPIGLPSVWSTKELDLPAGTFVFRGKNGMEYAATYTKDSVLAHELYYKQGDRVFVIRGLKYPVKIPIPEAQEYLCPACGNFIKPGKRRCAWCRSDFSEKD